MKHILVILFFLIALVCRTQINWKDSVRIKEPVVDAYKTNNTLYFQTKKGWGVYDLAQRAVKVPASNDFILATEDHTNRYIVVKKGKLFFVDKDLKQQNKMIYWRAGSGIERADAFAIENNYTIYPWKEEKHNYLQLDMRTENTLTLFKNYVLVNFYIEARGPQQVLTREGNDSTTADGKMAMQYFLPVMHSGVYDLKAKTWVIQPRFAKTGLLGNNVLVKEITLEKNQWMQKIHVYNASFDKMGTYRFDERGIEKKALKILLGDFSPKDPEPVRAGWLNYDIYKTDDGKTQALFDPVYFNFIVDTGKYEFVYIPRAYPRSVFTIKNGKVGCNAGDENVESNFSNDYNRLEKATIMIPQNETDFTIVTCNGEDQESLYLSPLDDFSPEGLSTYDLPVLNASLEAAGQFAIVQDFVPGKPGGYVVGISSITGVDSMVFMQGVPNFNGSGVFDLKTHKWIVPQQFTKIMALKEGFSCMRFSNDSLSFSFYSKGGSPVFKNIPVDALLANTAYLAQFTGVNYTGSHKHLLIDKNTVPNGMPLLVNEKEKAGVIDLLRMQWLVPPVYDLIDFNQTNQVYTVVQNKRIGLRRHYGAQMVQPVFKKIFYNQRENGFILNDSLFYKLTTNEFVPVDSVPGLASREVYDQGTHNVFSCEIIDEKLVTSEYMRSHYADYYHDYGYQDTHHVCLSRSVALNGFDQKKFGSATELRPWKNHYLIKDTLHVWRVVDEKNETLYSFKPDETLFVFPDYIYNSELSLLYYQSPAVITDHSKGNHENEIPLPTRLGRTIEFFDGGLPVKIPAGFYLLAANKSRTGLGFSLVKEGETTRRKFEYINLNTGTREPCEFGFSDYSYVEIIPVKGGFVFMQLGYEVGSTVVWHVQEDLKTVKSTFNNLVSWSTELSTYPQNRIILYKLVHGGNEMLFDKDFTFMQEAAAGSFSVKYPAWNKLVLKSDDKIIVMKLDGQVVKK
ncbi:MAG TPA: hypothetical protein VD905_05840 [Flavobacteriales bacterium]|nr:hypothetical protein [Flavobacteriales bacterium]